MLIVITIALLLMVAVSIIFLLFGIHDFILIKKEIKKEKEKEDTKRCSECSYFLFAQESPAWEKIGRERQK